MKTMISVPTQQCPECGLYGEISIEWSAWEIGKTKRWQGEYIQDCFPTLSPAEREQIMTGIHPKCWDEMFSDCGDEG